MNSLVLNPWRWIARWIGRSATTWGAVSTTRSVGRGAFLFFGVMPRGAPFCSLVRLAVLAFWAARRAVLWGGDVVRRGALALPFLDVPFFMDGRAFFPATARARIHAPLRRSPPYPKKYAPHGERLGPCFVSKSYNTFSAKIKALRRGKTSFWPLDA